MLDRFDIQKLQALPIEEVASALGLSVSHHKALCPFHADKHPSLTFHRGRNRYRCFVCDAHGGVIDLVMNYLHKDFVSACKWLSEEHSVVITVPPLGSAAWPVQEPSSLNSQPKKPFDASRYERFFARPFLSLEARTFLFNERRLDPRVIRWCRLTSWRDKQGTPWLQTPYYDREGKLIGIQNRNLAYGSKVPQPSSLRSALPLATSKNPQPRFKFPQGAKCSIYNLQILNLLRPGETLFIAEGCSDCWSLLSAGHKAIAIPSATLLTRKDKELLSSLSSSFSFAMYPDNDEPGEKLFLQLQKVLPNLVRYQLPAGCKDFSDFYLDSLISHPSSLLLQHC